MKSKEQITIESYNKTAKEYDKNTNNFIQENYKKKFLSKIKSGGLILDIGCGAGRDAKYFTEKGYEVIGIDMSSELLNIAKLNAPKAKFKLMNMKNIEFDSNTFDGIWANASLVHLPQEYLVKVLSSIYKILKPNGYFYVSVKQGEGEMLSSDSRYKGVEKFWSYYSEEEFKKALLNAHFTVLKYDISKIDNSYQTNPWIKFFCQKYKTI
jgi:ubiquinone/menaquinone biosynthesis C-methylase UbiE